MKKPTAHRNQLRWFPRIVSSNHRSLPKMPARGEALESVCMTATAPLKRPDVVTVNPLILAISLIIRTVDGYEKGNSDQ